MHTALSRGGSAWRMAAICAGLAFLGQTQAAEPSRSPFADKPADSYSNVTGPDGKPAPLIWGQAPFTDFGSRLVTCDQTGVRQIPQAPPAGVHPRICFGPEQIPDVRRRLKETRCGQEAWKNLLCWTEMMKGVYDDTQDYAKPDRWKGSFGGLHGRVPLFRMNIPRENKIAYNRHPKAAAIYRSLIDGTATEAPEYLWNVFALEAFRCLIDDDAAAAQDLGKATCTLLKLGQAKRIADQATAKKKKTTPNEQPIGGFQLAFTYDYIWNWLTPEQRQTLHAELADSTWSHDNYGTFNTAESSRSNWATFSYWLYQVLAIEGEPGFNDLKVRGMYRGWRNLLTYGWFQSGATFEGEAKNQLGEKIGVMFGNPETTTGGNALKFYASVRLDIRRQTQLKEGDEVVGNHVKVKVVKNKVAPPFRKAEFDIIFGEGISRAFEIIDLATELNVIKKSGSWFSYGDTKLGQGRDAVKKIIQDNPELADELEGKIRAVLNTHV
jgi:hypothetical protein